jgi:hypothetical protein
MADLLRGLQVMVSRPAAAQRLAADRLATLGGRTVPQFVGVALTPGPGTVAPK